MLLLEAHHSVYFQRAHTFFQLYVWMTSSESHCLCLKPNTLCSFTERIFVQFYGLICIMFWKTSSDCHCSCLKPTTQCPFTELIICSIVCLNVYIVLKKIGSESHCFCLKPTTQCTSTGRIHSSNECLNVYNVFKNFFWNPLLLLEVHHSLYFHRALTLFNCMFECV